MKYELHFKFRKKAEWNKTKPQEWDWSIDNGIIQLLNQFRRKMQLPEGNIYIIIKRVPDNKEDGER